ncbi:hypothetical protein P5673_021491 [Acropora cervicornis]|uniref:Uncharacterized protein n=1 Tax=Acropora cervicornis TaxID=6130 RepID=A0AAD9V0E8_ACRCE|nr:hypothetical protein P5673_021491 [Acropora cervicornis]
MRSVVNWAKKQKSSQEYGTRGRFGYETTVPVYERDSSEVESDNSEEEEEEEDEELSDRPEFKRRRQGSEDVDGLELSGWYQRNGMSGSKEDNIT